jgi:hypothetical protein
LGVGEFLPSNAFTNWIAGFFCDEGIFQGICENVVFILCGFDEAQTNNTLFETIVHHTPAGASTNTLLHYAQEINSSKGLSISLLNNFNHIYNSDLCTCTFNGYKFLQIKFSGTFYCSTKVVTK